MVNERVTEDMFEQMLRLHGFYDDPSQVTVEKQQSEVRTIRTALAKASKTGRGGAGYPEFIITSVNTPDMVVVVECKGQVTKHKSKNLDRPADFALDGALHYARALAHDYTVIGIAVSGEPHPKTSRWSVFLMNKGTNEPRDLVSPSGAKITGLVPMSDLLRAASYDHAVQSQRTHDLIGFSQEMHVFMRDEAELEEREKPLAVAGSLIALRNDIFRKTYQEYPAESLPAFWMETINKEVKAADLPIDKIENMTQPFTNIEVHAELRKAKKGYPKGLLNEIVTMLAEQVLPFLTVYHDFDVVGQFYGEFLRYTGGDGKGLGIVLTPRNVTELFALLANVNKDSIVVDTCAGTGGFLISAMMKMVATATTEAQEKAIKSHGLIGVEQQPTMYALAASNMILRGDGRANLYQGSCFDSAIVSKVTEHKPTIGLINPPYAKSKADLHELRFVEQMLDTLDPDRESIGIAIVPISCASGFNEYKRALLKKHTLEAVMSMPPEIFYPVGVVTCIMVFRAHVPHLTSGRKTWFGYWREDGFIKVKNLGRIDRYGLWPDIRDRWVEQYRNREVMPGQSVMAKVTAADEWVAEAYMQTDYSTLTQEAVEKVVLDYALFVLKGTQPAEGEDDGEA